MNELSMIEEIIKALEVAKQAGVGVEFSKLDAIELLGYIKNLEEEYELIKSELERLENAWLVDENIQSDGSLRPSLTDTIKRAEKAEINLENAKTNYELLSDDYKQMSISHDIQFDCAEKAEREADQWQRVADALAGELNDANSERFPVSWEDVSESSPAWIAYCNLRDRKEIKTSPDNNK